MTKLKKRFSAWLCKRLGHKINVTYVYGKRVRYSCLRCEADLGVVVWDI